MNISEYNQLLGAAIYEIRCQLGAYLGSKNDNDKAVRLSAHLAYALHNQVLSLIEGNEVFNLNESRKMIAQAQDIVGCKYIDSFGILSSKNINLPNSRITLLLGGQRALWGEISDGVISVSAQIDNLTIKWRCVFDSVRSKDALWLDLSSAAGE